MASVNIGGRKANSWIKLPNAELSNIILTYNFFYCFKNTLCLEWFDDKV